MRFVGVDEDVAVLVVGAGLGDADFLVPAVLTADPIWLHGERKVLMDATVLPKNALRIRIVAPKWLDAMKRADHPFDFARVASQLINAAIPGFITALPPSGK